MAVWLQAKLRECGIGPQSRLYTGARGAIQVLCVCFWAARLRDWYAAFPSKFLFRFFAWVRIAQMRVEIFVKHLGRLFAEISSLSPADIRNGQNTLETKPQNNYCFNFLFLNTHQYFLSNTLFTIVFAYCHLTIGSAFNIILRCVVLYYSNLVFLLCHVCIQFFAFLSESYFVFSISRTTLISIVVICHIKANWRRP